MPRTDSINMVEGPADHFDPSSTARMCFRGYNLVKHRPTSLFWFNLNDFCGSKDPINTVLWSGIA